MDALDSVRVDAWREAKAATKEQPKAKRGRPKKDTPSKDTTATELKNSKMALGKASSNLTPNQQAKVEWIAKQTTDCIVHTNSRNPCVWFSIMTP